MTKTYDLNRDSFRLFEQEPFWGALFRELDRVSTTSIPTAGVRYNPERLRFELVYNPDFFAKLTTEQRIDVLKHEGYHIVWGHCTSRKPAEQFAMLWNQAADLAINSHLDNLPEGCLKPGVGYFEDMPEGRVSEWYFNELRNNPPENNEGKGDSNGGDGESSTEGEGDGSSQPMCPPQFDDHSGWSDADDQAGQEIAEQRLREAVKKAGEAANQERNWGDVPREVREKIEKEYMKTSINWKAVLRAFVNGSRPNNKRSSIKRINRRYAYVHPGRRSSRTANIAISIDQSGSVSSDMLKAFYAELEKLADNVSFTVIPFDSEVFEDGVHEWAKGGRHEWKRYCYGGTCFNAPTKFVNENPKFDAHIILTDLCAPKPIPSRCNRMWITTEYYAKRPYFKTNERMLVIPDADVRAA